MSPAATKKKTEKKVWKDIWGSGQGIGAIKEVVPTRELINRFEEEYKQAHMKMVMQKLPVF